jgi:hypothetical protein
MFAHRVAGRLVSVLAVLSLAVGCAGGASPSPGIGPPGPAATDAGASSVRAEVTCTVTSRSSRTEGTNEIYLEHFSCTFDATDPRLDGRVEGDVTATFEPAAATAARWEGTYTLTNEGGSWQGQEKGALAIWPGSSGPYNYGQGTYTGSGAYAGLTYHYLIAGSNQGLVTSGWIDSEE